MRRVRPAVQATLDEIGNIKLDNPTWPEILIAITDEYDGTHLEAVPNNHDYLQLMVGFPKSISLSTQDDGRITATVLTQIRRAIHLAQLTPMDEHLVENALERSLRQAESTS
ncbi:MAG: hypothetical protein ACTHK7_24500 [Aureliella sp.]